MEVDIFEDLGYDGVVFSILFLIIFRVVFIFDYLLILNSVV